MIRVIKTLLPALLMVACTCKVPEKGALILGQVSALDPGDKIIAVLFQFDGKAGKRIQTDTLKNGHFTFRLDSLGEADHYMISLFRSGKGYSDVINYGPELYLDTGTVVRVKGEGKHFRTARIDSPVKDQKLRQRYLKKMSQEDWRALDDSQANYYRVINELYYAKGLTKEQKDSLRGVAQQILDASNEINDRLSKQEIIILEREEIGAFAVRRINSLAHQVSLGKKEYREAVLHLYGRLSSEQKVSRDGMEIINYLNPVKTVTVGSPVPSYVYFDKIGKSVYLSDFAGRWILVDFWSSSCHPCIESVLELGSLNKDFPDKLSVVSISLDKENLWREASKEHGIIWNDWHDPKGASGSFRAYGTTSVPTFVLVSPEGVITDIIVGYREGQLRRAVQNKLSP